MLAPSSRPERSEATGVENSIELTAEALWADVSARLQGALNDATYQSWFGEALGAKLTDEAFVVGVPNDFTREWIEGHFLGLLHAVVKDAIGRDQAVPPAARLARVRRPSPAAPTPADAPGRAEQQVERL